MTIRTAVSHVNRRDATYCPAIGELKNLFEVQYQIVDSHASGTGAVIAALKLIESDTIAGFTPGSKQAKVKVFCGPNSSPEAMGVHPFIGGAFKIPYISWAASSGKLTDKVIYPLYFRNVAPDSLTMEVVAGFVKWLGVTEAAALWIDDASYSTNQASDFLKPCKEIFDIKVIDTKIPVSGQGGAKMSALAKSKTKTALTIVRAGDVRCIIVFGINGEIQGFVEVAEELRMIKGKGWLWLAGDASTMFAEAKKRVDGWIYSLPNNPSQFWEPWKAKWKELMPNMKDPEFTTWKLCFGGTICEGRKDFYGFYRDGSKCLNSWLQEAYVAMMTLVVVGDRLMTENPGVVPNDFTNDMWFAGMKKLETPAGSFNCLSGTMLLNKNQERSSPVDFLQYQDNEGRTDLPHNVGQAVVGKFINNAYQWQVGQTIMWPSDEFEVITPALEFTAKLATLPSGRTPLCPGGMVMSAQEQVCMTCPAQRKGSVSVKVGDKARCMCGPGHSSNASLTPGGIKQCLPCEKGKFKKVSGDSVCQRCWEGTFRDEWMPMNGTECTRCAVGTYTQLIGQSVCTNCKKNFLDNGQGHC